MIDSFWTRWRIKQLARGESLLAGKWLDDYARWLYGRVWYRCQGDPMEAQRLLEKTFVSAAGRLKDYTAIHCPMSEWLLSVYEQLVEGLPDAGRSRQPVPELREAVGCLLIRPLSEIEPFWPELTELGQQALAMLSCDEQCLLMCRYFRLERPANTAEQYGMSLSEIQTLLYRASHSFRRILETLAQAGAGEASQRGQMDSAILETNLEKVFRTFVLEAPTLEFMAQLKERVEAIVAQNKPTGWIDSNKKKVYIGGGIAVLCGAIWIFTGWGNPGSFVNKEKRSTFRNSQPQTEQHISPTSTPDAAQEVQLAVRLGTAQDIEGLLGLLRTGTYPSQIAAAYYLGQYGDKSAINLLDQAAQKWYAENSTDTNPFIEAITAIENRMRLQARQELQAKVQSLLSRKPAAQETHPPLNNKIISQEPNMSAKEPNHPEPLLIVRVEPNQPLIIEEVVQYPLVHEPNQSP
jgi:DNA-directed RNA polymerase specialized sigma24 family protein